MSYDIIAELWADVEKKRQLDEAERAKADPKAFKDSRVFIGCKSKPRYYELRDTPHKGHTVRFGWTLNKNCAGYYLSYIEVLEGGRGARTKYCGYKQKKTCIEEARARYFDAKKPKAERKYTIPTVKELYDKR